MFLIFPFVFLLFHTYSGNHGAGRFLVHPSNENFVITDITIAKCFTMDILCDIGPWHRIDKDLYLSRLWFTKAYVFVRGRRHADITTKELVVKDIYVGNSIPETIFDEQWEPRPAGLWVKRSTHDLGTPDDIVSGVDVLFGPDAVEARDGWTKLHAPILLNEGARC